MNFSSTSFSWSFFAHCRTRRHVTCRLRRSIGRVDIQRRLIVGGVDEFLGLVTLRSTLVLSRLRRLSLRHVGLSLGRRALRVGLSLGRALLSFLLHLLLRELLFCLICRLLLLQFLVLTLRSNLRGLDTRRRHWIRHRRLLLPLLLLLQQLLRFLDDSG